jgi:DNA-binding transcriptional ArsR family regulator
MKSSRLDSAVTVARALGHPARLRALAMLRSGELCVCQITAVLGLAPSTVSLHLRELRRAGIVRERKQGRWVYVGLSDELDARSWVDLALAAAGPDPQLARDAAMVDELRRMPVEDLCRLGIGAVRTQALAAAAATL